MSISDKLGGAAGIFSVTVPASRVVGAASTGLRAGTPLPATLMGGKGLTIQLVDVHDPEAAPVEPSVEEMMALYEQACPVPVPGYVAISPAPLTVEEVPFEIVDGKIRLRGARVRDQPYLLVRIDDAAGDDADPLAALDDVAARRRDVLAAFASQDRARIASAYRGLIDDVLGRDDLGDVGRRRIARGLAREYQKQRQVGFGSVPRPLPGWKAFVASLPGPTIVSKGVVGRREFYVDDRGFESVVTMPAEAQRVHWNTRLLDGGRAADAPIVVGRIYQLASKIDPDPDDDALAGGTVELLREDPRVTFVVECAQPVLRLPGDQAWGHHAEGTVTYDATRGATDAVIVELCAAQPGAVKLVLRVITGNAERTRVSVKIDATATSAPGPVQAAPALAVTGTVQSGPRAALRLDFIAGNQLKVETGPSMAPPVTLASSAKALEAAAIHAHRDLIACSQSYRSDPARAPFGLLPAPTAPTLAGGQAQLHRLAVIGSTLHAAFFGLAGEEEGDANRRKLAKLIASMPVRERDARLQIGAAFQPFPWAVFYDGDWRGHPLDPDDPGSVDPSSFWGRRFRIDRSTITDGGGAPRSPSFGAPMRVQACINPHLDDEQGTSVLPGQRTQFDGLAQVVAAPVIASDQALRDFLKAQPAKACDLLYFFCHATSAESLTALFTFTTDPPETQARLILDDGDGVDVATMRRWRGTALDDRPLVMLNACGSVAGDPAFSSPLLFQFLSRWRATGVIGTDWEVPTEFADAFGRRFLQYFLRDHLPLADAFARARDDAFAQGNPFPLIYALYAPPDLTFQPGATP